MSKESRRARGAKYAQYKKEREIKYAARTKAKESYFKNWNINQKKVAQAIAALEEYYGEEFHQSAYSSDELIDLYDKIYVENNGFPDLNPAEVEEVNRRIESTGRKLQVVKQEESPTSVKSLYDALKKAHPEYIQENPFGF